MRIPSTPVSASALALVTLSSLALAQPRGPAPPLAPSSAAPQPAVFDPQQFPAIRGELERLTLTSRGDVDGFILKDGTEVKTAPELGAQIAFAIKSGDRVTVHGLKAAALPLVRAVSITDENTHLTVTDSSTAVNPPPPAGPPVPGAITTAPATPRETAGTVRMALHGPQGEVNGVLLDNGAILRFPPDQADSIAAAIQPQKKLVAQGIATTTAMGTVIEVQQIGASRDQLVAVAPPPRRPIDRSPNSPE